MQNQSHPNPLLHDSLRIPVERVVSEHIGRQWSVQKLKDLNDLASHPCAILSDGSYSVFIKLSEAANGLDQFELELAGLRFLSQHTGVLVPALIGNVVVENGTILVLEAVQAVERTADHWRQIGRTLARIHRIQRDQFGFEKQGYFGPLYQDNRPLDDWLTFYTERRLWPRLMAAIESGNMPTDAIREVEQLILRIPNLIVPKVVPSLLHGDAQQNNFISTEMGTVVVDPAIYFGNPEIDLAYIDYFQPVPEDVFIGYREEMPIDAGFSERRDLWRVSAYLAAVTVEGVGQLQKLTNAVRKYL